MANLMTQNKSFVTGLSKSGIKGLALLLQDIDHMFKHKDWTPLAWLLSKTEGADSVRLRSITSKVVGGVTMRKDKEQPSGLRIVMGDNAAPTENINALRALVDNEVSFRSKKVKDDLGIGKATVPAQFDVNKYAKSVANKLSKEEVSVADLMKAMAAIK